MSEPMVYAVMDGPDAASAICVIDRDWDEAFEEFLAKHSGKKIRIIPLKEGLILTRRPRGRFATLWRKLVRRLDRARLAR